MWDVGMNQSILLWRRKQGEMLTDRKIEKEKQAG